MALNINEIKSQLALGGARPALFQVVFNNPVNASGDVKVPFMVKAAQMPASTLGTIEVPYFGRKIKIAGDRTFANVTQFSKTGVPIREYAFNGIFPTEVSTIDLDWNSTDAIEEFTITFQYDHWEVSGLTGNAGGN